MLQESLALCGRMIKPPALKIRSTGADEAGTHKTWFATSKRAGYSSDFSFQKSKIFEGNTVIVKARREGKIFGPKRLKVQHFKFVLGC